MRLHNREVTPMQYLLLLLALLLASPAFAESWSAEPTGTTATCPTMQPGVSCFFNDSGTDDSPGINLSGCLNGVTLLVNSDLTAITTGAEGYWRMCSGDILTPSECNQVYTDAGAVTLNGDPAVGRSAAYGIMGRTGYWENISNAGADAYRLTLVCH